MNPPSNAVVMERAKATGIDLRRLPFSEEVFCNYVRKAWPTYVQETGQRIEGWMPAKGSDDYYENVAAAASTGSEGLTNLFTEVGPPLSREQQKEVIEYLLNPHKK